MLGWFRRHAKILMVVLGSAAMAIFGLGPVFDTLASRGNRDDSRENEVVATWKGGKITRDDLDQMEMQHYQALRFLGEVRKQAEKKKGDVINSLALEISPIQDGKREMVDDQLITRFLLAERAKEEGMIVSDGMVTDYLLMYSGDAGFSKKDLVEINSVANNRYCSLQSVNNHLKTELLANQMQLCTMTGVPIVPNPSEAVELYGRTMEQIECEALPLEVDKYLDQVNEKPPTAEIKRLYEEGKFQFPDPTGERPGFKIGRKINVQYLVADYETYLQNEVNKLKVEDIQAEYDRMVEEEDDLIMEPIPADDNAIELDVPPPTEKSTAEPKTGDAPSDVDAPPTEPAKTPETEPTKEPESEPKKESEAESGESERDDDSDDDQSLTIRSSKFQFASTRTQEEEATKEEATGGEQAATEVEAKQEEAKQEEAAKTDGPAPTKKPDPADESDTETKAAETTQNPAVDPGAIDPSKIQDAIDSLKLDDKIKRRPKPLKDVAEQVKRSMCSEAASKTMAAAIAKADVRINLYFQKRMEAEFDDKKMEDIPPLDVEALAKECNLVAKETGLVDDVEIDADALGGLRIFMNMMSNGQPRPQMVPVGQLIFNEFSDLKLYDPDTVSDNFGTKNVYLFWAREKTNTRIPELKEVENEVTKFWKSKKAFDLAMAEAESIRKNVNDKTGQKMSELYSGRAFPTGSFTWFSNFGGTRYGSPIGVRNAGDKFMEVAFSLGNMEAGVAANESQDTIYVLQAISEPKPIEEVGTDYLENQYFKFKRIPNEVIQVSRLYFQELNLNWNQEFQDTMDLKFLDR